MGSGVASRSILVALLVVLLLPILVLSFAAPNAITYRAGWPLYSYVARTGGGTINVWLAWNYRIPIKINNTQNSNTLTDYQVKVVLDTASLISAGKMKPDGSDIRFTDEDGQTQLSYWIESGINTTKTVIWVKVPSIPALSTKTIYMYYGNPSATSQSDPRATMFIYEDFTTSPSGTLVGSATYDPTNKWVQLTPNTQGQLGYLYYDKVPTNPTGFYAKFYFWTGGGNGADAVWLGVYDYYFGTEEDIVNGGYHFTYDEFQDRICFTKSITDNGEGISCVTQLGIDNSQWHLAEVYFWYTDKAYARIYYDGALKVSASDPLVQLNVINGVGKIIFGGRTVAYCNYHRIGNGLLYIAKYTYPEPKTSLGPEELIPAAPPSPVSSSTPLMPFMVIACVTILALIGIVYLLRRRSEEGREEEVMRILLSE
jgi:hypothetical protein